MSEVHQCAECGTPLPAYWPKGLCTECAISRALDMTHAESQVQDAEKSRTVLSAPAPPSGPENAPLGSFGDYELLEEIARGGMGVVYKARQRKLDRIVAVKMILGGSGAGKDFVQRFRTEASAAAVLQHPNIVAIHDVGVQEGRHYFSMDYVEGQNLGQVVSQQPLAPVKAARYVALIAEAIHYAHERGILHRDLKPSNVLIDRATDQPRVTDFGLAKRLDGESSLTISGQVLGSPNFMPPEQAGGRRGQLGRFSDVYALGAILYYLLTARAPFQADSLEHILWQVLNAEPVSPRLLNPCIPSDLETITLKCLEKEPSRRYQTSQELADELGRFLSDEPIQARPVNAAQKLWRWCHRKPAVAGAIGFAAAALLIGLAATSWQWRRAKQQQLAAEHLLYVANMNLIQAAWDENNISRCRQLLMDTAAAPERNFEWFYWQRQMHLERQTLRGRFGSILAVAYSRDGQKVVTGSADWTAKVWDAVSGSELLPLKGHSNVISSVAFSPDAGNIVTGSWDGTAKVWDASNGKELLSFNGHRDAIYSVAVSSDGRRVVTGSADHTAKVWDASSGKALFTLSGHTNRIWSVAFSPDGQRIVTGSTDGTARVWSASTGGKELMILDASNSSVFSVAYSPDGHRIVAGTSDSTVKSWDAATGLSLAGLVGHGAPVYSVAFSSDGRRILTGSMDQTARIWEAASGRGLLIFKGHTGAIFGAAFSPDGERIATGSGSVAITPDGLPFLPDDEPGSVKLWNARSGESPGTLNGHSSDILSVAFSPEGQRIVSGSWDTTAKVWNAADGKEPLLLEGHTRAVHCVAFSRDGERIVTGSQDGTAKVWDASTGTNLITLQAQSQIQSVALSPDSRRVITGGTTAIVWDVASGAALFRLQEHSNVWSVAYSSNGQRLLTGSWDGTGKVWEASSGRQLLTLEEHKSAIRGGVAFSPDGRRIVMGSLDRTATVWDAISGKRLFILKGHGSRILGVAFSSDGLRIVTSSADKTAKVWETSSGLELLNLRGHDGIVFSAAFSPDGERIVTGSGDDTIKLWRAASKAQVARWEMEERTATLAENPKAGPH